MREPADNASGGCQRARPDHGCCGRSGGRRARKGWIRAAILVLLSERPRHGYEMITELSERTNGSWTPSPGAIYPALQLLTDEGLISSEADGGRRKYTLTDAGQRAVAASEGAPAPWASMTAPANPTDDALQEALAQANAAASQVLFTGTAPQKVRASEVLVEARRALYRILAESE